MNKTLGDLNNHLFAQLERLGDEALSAEELETEVKRSTAMGKIATQIINNGELAYKTMKHMDEYGYRKDKERVLPEMLEVKNVKKVSRRND